MNESTANEFFDRLVEGTDYTKTIELTHGSGATLGGVEVHPVDKGTLADVIQNLPDEMFDAVEDADNPEEAEEMLEGGDATSMAAMSSGTVTSFEKLAKESLRHPDLTSTQMDKIVEELDFGTLFELGGDIIDMSFSEGGAIKDFRVQK